MNNYCIECKQIITPEEYDYSINKYGKPICREHQKTFSLENKGLSKKNTEYRYNMIKGRIAEALIEELFLSLEYNVFRYGMENTVPGIMKLLKGVRSDVANTIKKMPDFVMQNKTGDVFFVEVKFRANEEFSINDIDKDYPFTNAFFIIVSKNHIKCLSYNDLKSGKQITPKCHNYLGNIKEFELDKEVIIDYCDFAVKFFSDV